MELEFRQIRYFLAVAEELHFRRAAERLHVAQPAISQQIARLEADLGVLLLERSSRSVQLTAAGQTFLTHVYVLLRHRDDAITATRRAASGEIGRLNIGFVGPAALSVLSRLIRAYRTRYPDVDLNLHELATMEQLKLLDAQELDVGFLRLPAPADGLTFELVETEPICILLPVGHPLNQRPAGTPVDVTELADHPLITVPRDLEPVVVDQIIALCIDAGFSPQIVQEAAQMYVIIALVNAEMGLVLVPESLRMLQHAGVAFRPLRSRKSIAVKTGMAWRTSNTSPVLASFLQFARELLSAPEDASPLHA